MLIIEVSDLSINDMENKVNHNSEGRVVKACLHSWQRGRVVKAPCLQLTWPRLKTHSHYSAVSLGKTLYGIFPCLVVLASSSKFQSYLYLILSGQQYLVISGSRSG